MTVCDYVIVGAGSAGCVLAARLTEDPTTRADLLRRFGIATLVDAARVGDGLQDHPWCLPLWHTPNVPSLPEQATPENMALWQREGVGPMTSNGPEAGGFARTGRALTAPDLQLGAVAAPDPRLGPQQRRTFATLLMAIDVRSRGRISLRSSDPRAAPSIDPAYLSDPADLEILVEGVRLAREIVAREPLASLVAVEDSPGADVRSDAGIRDWIRRTMGTIFHPTSSCAMGGADSAVCDPELRVRGVEGLRIVDASVMPAVPRGNTNAPTIAIAERAADLIRGRRPLTSVDAR